MAFKVVILAALVAVANAGLLGAPLAYGAAVAPAAITSQQSNILRSYGNLGQVSTYSKTIDTPYSSVSKSDVRVSNDAVGIAAAPAVAYGGLAAPALVGGLAAPALVGGLAAPALAAHAVAAPAVGLGVTYSAAPAVAHLSYSGIHAAYGY